MALQLGALRNALVDAGAKPDLAGRASEELAAMDREFTDIRRDILLMKWMIGFVLAFQVVFVLKLLGP